MSARWLLGVGMLTLLGAAPAPEASKPDLAEYEAARATVGRDADAQVKLALWCQARGLSAEGVKHLAMAVITDPKNAAARGLLGLVEYGGRWQRPDAVAAKVKADEALTAKLAEYNALRANTAGNADAQLKLALWCEKAGLEAEARAHFTAVTQLDPSRDAAWKHLGLKRIGHRWATDEQIAAEASEAEAQRKADEHWKPFLTRCHTLLRDKDRSKRERAEERLGTVSDPRAVPSIWAVFGTGDAASQATAVVVLGGIDAGGSSRALAALAVYGKSAEVRKTATETLRRRDPRDFVGILIGLIRDPLKYEVKPVDGPNSPGVLFVEGQRYNVRRVYGFTPAQLAMMNRAGPRIFDSSVPFNPFGAENYAAAMAPATVSATVGHGGAVAVPSLTAIAARRDIQIAQQLQRQQELVNVSQQQLINDVNEVEAMNAGAREINGRALPVLTNLTGQSEALSSDDWKTWWSDQQGYVYDRPPTPLKPTYTQFVANSAAPTHHSCFAAGTLVRTREGTRPIEALRVGDQVLTQNTTTGRLSFVPVLRPVHNKPAATFKLSLGTDSVVATGIHRFWKAGHGWVMVRDLKPGDVLRTVGGTIRVGSVESEPVQPVFNLEVGDTQTYFVGGSGLLVHDNTLVKPVPLPFDAEPTLAALAR